MSRERKILIVDDESNNIMVLKSLLTRMGHEVISADNAIEALNLLDNSFDLILSDVMMPKMDGFEMVERVRNNSDIQGIPIIMVTTLADKASRLKAVEAGANDFITKPVDAGELRVRTNSMLKQKAQQDEIQTFNSQLQKMVEDKTSELKRAFIDLDNSNREAIQHLSAAAEFKDEDTATHIQRMARYSALIAAGIGLEKKEVDLILTSAPMHDVGKLGVPDSILLKPGKLDADEWKIMKQHTLMGGKILGGGDSEYMAMGVGIALSHHEKWDGTGYPFGLAGEDIPLPGRICAVADVFDAVTSKRPYKEAFPLDKALAIMKDGRGSHFDPNVLDVFLEHLDEVIEIHGGYGGR